ncbi:MAG TPA: alpha-L-arabinofuranosidase C-terminal domain-containing protein, partial [Methylococcales bacterium]
VNVLQAMILTKKDKMLLTPTYHVFDMYKVHQNATMLPTSLEVGKYEMSKQSIPTMNVSASKDKNGVIHVSVCNFKPNEDIELKIDINGQKVRTVKSTILTAPEMNSRNTFDAPNSVVPISVADVPVTDGGLKVKIPAKSVVMFEIK